MTAVVSATSRRTGLPDLVEVAAAATAMPLATVQELAATLLALPDEPAEPPGATGLNNDGSPLQICFSATADAIHCRMLADPASEIADPVRRFHAAHAAMRVAAQRSQSAALLELCERTLDFNLPPRRDVLSDYPDGVLWVGAGVDTPGLAMYVDARRGGPDVAWPRLAEWFASILPSRGASDAAIAAISPHATIMCLGVEGLSPLMGRAKFYWRLSEPGPLSDLGVERFTDRRFVRFLEIAMRDRDIRMNGIVPSIGFALHTGALTDVKLDVCTCRNCLDSSAEEWQDLLDTLSAELGCARVPVRPWLERSEMAFIGFGLDHHDAPRLNVYLKRRLS